MQGLVAQQAKNSTIVLCMYEAPLAEMRAGMYPAYPGSAWSMDGGTSWKQSGLLTSTTNDIARSMTGSHHYLATDAGLFVSADRGSTWKQCTDGSMGAVLSVLPLSDGVWIGTVTGVYHSANEGQSWVTHSTGLPALDGTYVTCLMHTEDALLASTGAGVFARSKDGGDWQPRGLPSIAIRTLVQSPVDPKTIVALTESQGLSLSTDAGRTWNDAQRGLPSPNITAYAFHPTDPATRLVAIAQHGVMRSTDAGVTWAYANGGLSNLQLTSLGFDPANPSIALAGSGSGAYISFDGAGSWSNSNVRLGYVSAIRFFSER